MEADAQPQLAAGEAAESAGTDRSATELGPAGPDGKDCARFGRSAIPEEAGNPDPAEELGTGPETHHLPATPMPRTLEREVGLACRPSTGLSPVPATQPAGRGSVTSESEVGPAHPPFTPLLPGVATQPDGRSNVSCVRAARIGSNGYGIGTGREAAHREAFRKVHGPIPAGAEIHHSCHNKWCVEPEHLVALNRTAHLKAHVWPALERWRSARRDAGDNPSTPRSNS